MMPYDFALEEAPAWPDSLMPFHCIYVARHGARYMTGPKKFDKLERVLRQQAEAGNLNADGQALLTMVDSIRTLSDGRWGQLSAVGIREQEILGKEMARMVPSLGHGNRGVLTISSFVPRAMMTMYEFNHAMMLANDSLDFVAVSGHEYSPLVYFFATDSVYAHYRESGSWKEVVRKFERTHIPTVPLQRLFRHPVGMNEHKAQDLVMDIYTVLQSRRAMGMSAPTDRFLTAGEYRTCWLAGNLARYLRNCVNPLNGDMVQRAVATLVATIIDDADSASAAQGGECTLNGYFGHAETLMPLLSALKIPGCHAMTTDAEKLATQWRSEDVVPLGANFAIFLFHTPQGTMAAVRLNGRNVKPVPGQEYMVKWSELKDYWLSLIPSMTASQSK